jgi:hypothetical protein
MAATNGTYWLGTDGQVYVAGNDGVNSAGAWDANTENYWNTQGYVRTSDPVSGTDNVAAPYSTQELSTIGSGGTGSSTPAYSQEDLAYLDGQMSSLDRQYNRLDPGLADAQDAILNVYNRTLSDANKVQGRNIEDFDMKTQISETGRSRELGKNDTRARSLANGLRQRIGLASGSGSSAYQVTAPKAVQQEASEGRTDILGNYASNFMALDRDKRRADKDFADLLKDLETEKKGREMGVINDTETKKNDLREMKKIVAERLKEDRKKSVTLNPNLVLDNFNMMLSLLSPFGDNQVLIYVHIPKVLRIMCDCPTS